MSVADRILVNLEKLVRSFMADASYSKAWSYTVTEATETTFSGRALSSRSPQPDLPKIPNMPGLPGTLLKPDVGSVVLVVFADGDPAQPRAVHWGQTVPVSIGLAGGGPALHRVGDFGQAGTLTGAGALGYSGPNGGSGTITATVIVSAVGPTAIPVVFAGAASLTTQATTGSEKVTSG
jgi:hypothetical protein